jgi:MFS family permease
MRWILPVIVIAQFFCTSLWFAGNAIVTDIAGDLAAGSGFIAHLTSAIQFGFITGTLVFAVLAVSDRHSPSRVFFFSALVAGVLNLGMSIEDLHTASLLSIRFFTGFFLAGIYPVGMKIASDYYREGLGKSLGLLVGALVLGTAFPHLIKNFTADFPWKYVVYTTSALSFSGGLMILFMVPDGPHRKAGQKFDLTAFLSGFRNKNFSSAAFGYFGHMWELYAFWAFVPVMLTAYKAYYHTDDLNIPLYSFLIIASGGAACALSGLLSEYFGVKKLATLALFSSCVCCILSPLFLFSSQMYLMLAFLFFWGLVVIADSPLFSTLVARNAPEESRGSALTIVNCIGFSITILSIQLINILSDTINARYIYTLLAAGPVLGLIALLKRPAST